MSRRLGSMDASGARPVLVAVLALMVAGCGASQGPTAGRAATATPTGSPSSPLSSASPSNTVLLTADSGPADPGTGPGWRFQIRYPSTYTMTPDSAFGTGGSVAPPRMSLTIGFQPVPPNPSYGQTQHDCILVWSTYRFSSISEWERSLSSTAPPSVSPESTPRVVTETRQRVGSLDVLIREVADPSSSTHRFEAFVELGGPNNLSYFFNSCNDHSRQDFTTVVESFAPIS